MGKTQLASAAPSRAAGQPVSQRFHRLAFTPSPGGKASFGIQLPFPASEAVSDQPDNRQWRKGKKGTAI
jgi:hypothetical protein